MQIFGNIFNKIVYYFIFRRKILIIDIFSAEKQVALGMGDHGTTRKYTEIHGKKRYITNRTTNRHRCE